jgi:hypothetical protein
MRYLWTFMVFFVSTLFDVFMLGGTVYLIQFFNWSPWWFVFSVCICVGASPTVTLKTFREKEK